MPRQRGLSHLKKNIGDRQSYLVGRGDVAALFRLTETEAAFLRELGVYAIRRAEEADEYEELVRRDAERKARAKNSGRSTTLG